MDLYSMTLLKGRVSVVSHKFITLVLLDVIYQREKNKSENKTVNLKEIELKKHDKQPKMITFLLKDRVLYTNRIHTSNSLKIGKYFYLK